MLYLQIQQITKILNSHMDSLQWIDQNTSKKFVNVWSIWDHVHV